MPQPDPLRRHLACLEAPAGLGGMGRGAGAAVVVAHTRELGLWSTSGGIGARLGFALIAICCEAHAVGRSSAGAVDTGGGLG